MQKLGGVGKTERVVNALENCNSFHFFSKLIALLSRVQFRIRLHLIAFDCILSQKRILITSGSLECILQFYFILFMNGNFISSKLSDTTSYKEAALLPTKPMQQRKQLSCKQHN